MQVSRWGDSLAIRLPKTLVEQLGLEAGDELEIVEANEATVRLRRVDRRTEALARMAARAWNVPEGWRFERDEANER